VDKISWADRVENEEKFAVSEGGEKSKEGSYNLHTTNSRKADWIGHLLRRNCLLKHVTEGKIEGRIEVTGRRGRSCKQILDDVNETRGYWEMKEEALDGTVWKTGFGRGCGPVVRCTVGSLRCFEGIIMESHASS
jgi:hypothetical protein